MYCNERTKDYSDTLNLTKGGLNNDYDNYSQQMDQQCLILEQLSNPGFGGDNTSCMSYKKTSQQTSRSLSNKRISKKKQKKFTTAKTSQNDEVDHNMIEPRILVSQTSNDRPNDYMNKKQEMLSHSVLSRKSSVSVTQGGTTGRSRITREEQPCNIVLHQEVSRTTPSPVSMNQYH